MARFLILLDYDGNKKLICSTCCIIFSKEVEPKVRKTLTIIKSRIEQVCVGITLTFYSRMISCILQNTINSTNIPQQNFRTEHEDLVVDICHWVGHCCRKTKDSQSFDNCLWWG